MKNDLRQRWVSDPYSSIANTAMNECVKVHQNVRGTNHAHYPKSSWVRDVDSNFKVMLCNLPLKLHLTPLFISLLCSVLVIWCQTTLFQRFSAFKVLQLLFCGSFPAT